MKLRDILKIVSFVLLLSGILMSLKYPVLGVLERFDLVNNIIGSSAIAYYGSMAGLIDVVIYVIFALYVNQLDSKFPKAHFGRFFRIDIAVTIINVIILHLSYENLILGYVPKIILEALACVTTFLCGHSIYQTLKNNAMCKIRASYWLLSVRHVIYFCVLCVQLFYLSNYDGYTPEQFGTTKWVIAQWVLLMPILLASRALLFWGTMGIKTHHHRHRAD